MYHNRKIYCLRPENDLLILSVPKKIGFMMTMMKYEIKDIMNIIITSFCYSQKKDTTALSLLSIIEGSLITIRYHMLCFLWAGISKLEMEAGR